MSQQIHGFYVHDHAPQQDLDIINDIYLNDAYRTLHIKRRPDVAETVVDIGAHIGTFTRLWFERNPLSRIVSIEACPDNIDLLIANVGAVATVLHAACTYESGRLGLLNAVGPHSTSTGGSIVVPFEALGRSDIPSYYKPDAREMPKITLHEVMEQHGMDYIDILKLDCESCEFSVLEHAPIEKIHFIVLESHGSARWRELLQKRFSDWDIGHMKASGEFENWHLRNPRGPYY